MSRRPRIPGIELQKELVGVTSTLSIYGFASELIGVFVPLLILRNGAALWHVPAFYVVYAVVKLCVNFPIAKYIVQRHGAHMALGAGLCATIGQMLALRAFVEWGSAWWLGLAAAMLACANATIWISQHLHIAAVAESATTSSSVATISVVGQLLSFIAPLVGGLIGSWLGSGALLAFAIACLLTAFIPLRLVGGLEANRLKEQSAEPLRYSLASAPKRDLLANFCWNIETATGAFVWPIFLAVAIASYSSIGIITTVAGGLSIVVMWVAGKRGDRGADRRVLQEAALISSAANIARIFANATFALAAITAVYRCSVSYAQVAWSSSYYKRANQMGPQWVMAMEIVCDLAYLLLWSLLLLLSVTVTSHVMFTVAFVMAGVCAWGCLLMRVRL